jgi:hypothetical protein
MEQGSLFGAIDEAPLAVPVAEYSREEFERDRFGCQADPIEEAPLASPDPDPAPIDPTVPFVSSRVPGECIRQVLYASGRTAVDLGAVTVERLPSMDVIHQDGTQRYCFFRDSIHVLADYIRLDR